MSEPATDVGEARRGSPPPAPVASPDPVASLGAGADLALRLLAGGFYVSLWSIVIALLAAAVWFAADASAVYWRVPAWAVAFWAAFTALFLILAQFGLVRRRTAGRPLTREQAPRFFAVLDDVGERLGVGRVSAVRLKPAPVMAAARVLRMGRFAITEQRALIVGLPLLRGLSVDEFRAAVAHEFAHLAGGDLRRGRIVHAAWRRIALMRSVLERGRAPAAWLLTGLNPIWWYLVVYGALLRRGASVVRRRQEERADALAASVVGADTYAHALIRTAALALAFRRVGPGLLVRAVEAERRVDNYFLELSNAIDALSPSARRRLVRDALSEHDEEATDHPPLRERLTSLGYRGEGDDGPDAERAATLVPDLASVERDMTPLVLRGLALGLGAQLRRRRELHRTAQGAAADADATTTPPSS